MSPTKSRSQVIRDFHHFVNMTTEELEPWLESDDSTKAGWHSQGEGNEDGETVGHQSGRKIVEILKDNPQKQKDKYTDEQVEHMRKVVAYCKRHLAQERKANEEKSPGELRDTKSYISLKNWGHDFLRAEQGRDAKRSATPASEENDGQEANGEKEKRKRGGDGNAELDDEEKEPKRRREGRRGRGRGETKVDGNDDDDAEAKTKSRKGKGRSATSGRNGQSSPGEQGKGQHSGPRKGDDVSWNWGGGKAHGKVLDVKGEKTTITTKNGNQVSRNGTSDDPAVVLDAGKSKAIKAAHELS